MRLLHRWRYAVTFAVLPVIVTACDRSPTAERQQLSVAAGELYLHGLDKEFYDLAATIPGGFGGYYIEGEEVVARLRDLASAEAARESLDVSLREKEVPSVTRFVVANYDFQELAHWRSQILTQVAPDGLVSTDIEETRNRIRIGVRDESKANEVASAAEAQGVPSDAVTITVEQPPKFAADINFYNRPMRGGFQIASPWGPIGSTCTAGFNAARPSFHSDYGKRFFVTNSHCSGVFLGQDTARFYQPWIDPQFHQIGTEHTDPATWGGPNCATGYTCRYSDSNLVEYYDSVSWDFAGIARLVDQSGTRTIDSANPSFRIVWFAGYPIGGQELDKVGRTTGWSSGPVTSTCVDWYVVGNVVLKCQDVVGARSGDGDSGSPVFSLEGGNNVSVYGILWGSIGTQSYVMSASSNITTDLGPLVIH